MRTLAATAASLLRTLASMMTPCSVNAMDGFRTPPQLDVAFCDFKRSFGLRSELDVAVCDFKSSSSGRESRNMKLGGNRPAFRLTCSFKRLVLTPYICARSRSNMTCTPRIVRMRDLMKPSSMEAGETGTGIGDAETSGRFDWSILILLLAGGMFWGCLAVCSRGTGDRLPQRPGENVACQATFSPGQCAAARPEGSPHRRWDRAARAPAWRGATPSRRRMAPGRRRRGRGRGRRRCAPGRRCRRCRSRRSAGRCGRRSRLRSRGGSRS